MKKFYLVFLISFLLVSLQGMAQKNKNFEGKITYQNSYESHVTGVNDEMLNSMLGDRQEFYIKNDIYMFEMNGSYTQKQYYVPVENRLYTKFSTSDTLVWIDVNEWSVEVISSEMVKTDVSVLGYKCNALILTTNKGKETYYFNRHLKADPILFKKHKFLNMAYVLSQTESIPLKIVLENEEMNLISTAIDIEPGELEDSIFKLPDAPSKPSVF